MKEYLYEIRLLGGDVYYVIGTDPSDALDVVFKELKDIPNYEEAQTLKRITAIAFRGEDEISFYKL